MSAASKSAAAPTDNVDKATRSYGALLQAIVEEHVSSAELTRALDKMSKLKAVLDAFERRSEKDSKALVPTSATGATSSKQLSADIAQLLGLTDAAGARVLDPLLTDSSVTARTAASPLSGVVHRLTLAAAARQAYFEDRLALLQVWLALLRIDNNPDHPYHQAVSTFVSKSITNESDVALLTTVMNQFKALHAFSHPVIQDVTLLRGEGGALVVGAEMFFQVHLEELAKQALHEQVLLLQFMFQLLFKRISCPSLTLSTLVATFVATSFALSGTHAGLLPASLANIRTVTQYRHMCVLVLLAAMQLNLASDGGEAGGGDVESKGDSTALVAQHPLANQASAAWPEELLSQMNRCFSVAVQTAMNNVEVNPFAAIIAGWYGLRKLTHQRFIIQGDDEYVPGILVIGMKYLAAMLRDLATIMSTTSVGDAHAFRWRSPVHVNTLLGGNTTPLSTLTADRMLFIESAWNPDLDAFRDVVLETLGAIAMHPAQQLLATELEAMIELAEAIFTGHSAAADQLWATLSTGTHPLAPVFVAAVNRYPLDTLSIVRLMTAVITDESHASQAFFLLGGGLHSLPTADDAPGPALSLSSFTYDITRDTLLGNCEVAMSDSLCMRIRVMRAIEYRSEGTRIPPHTVGTLHPNADASGGFVMWEHIHSIWPVLFARLASTAHKLHADGSAAEALAAAPEVSALMSLLATMFAADAAVIDKFVAHIEIEWLLKWLHDVPLHVTTSVYHVLHALVAAEITLAQLCNGSVPLDRLQEILDGPSAEAVHDAAMKTRREATLLRDDRPDMGFTTPPLEWLCSAVLSVVQTYGNLLVGRAAVHHAFNVPCDVIIHAVELLAAIAAQHGELVTTCVQGMVGDAEGGVSSVGEGFAPKLALFSLMETILSKCELNAGKYAGTIAFLSLSHLLCQHLLRRRVLIDLHAPFAKFDTDGDGQISTEEFRDGMLSLGCTISDKALRQLQHKLDVDGDGEVSYHEFVNFTQHEQAAMVAADEDDATTADDAAAVDQVTVELRAFLADITKRTRGRLTRDYQLLSQITTFAAFTFANLQTWRFEYSADMWTLRHSALLILRAVMEDNYVPPQKFLRDLQADSVTIGSRNALFAAFLDDQMLQSALLAAATTLATTAMRPRATGADDWFAMLLPLDFYSGLFGSLQSAFERQLIERVTHDALSVLCILLRAQGPDAAVGVDGTAWRAPDKVSMLTAAVGGSAQRYAADGVGLDVDMNGRQDQLSVTPNKNLVVALAGLVGFPQVAPHAIACQALQVLSLLCRCMKHVSSVALDRPDLQHSIMAYLAGDGAAFRNLLLGTVNGVQRDPEFRLAVIQFAQAAFATQSGLTGLLMNITQGPDEPRDAADAVEGGNKLKKQVRFADTDDDSKAEAKADDSTALALVPAPAPAPTPAPAPAPKPAPGSTESGVGSCGTPSLLLELVDILKDAATLLKTQPVLVSHALQLVLAICNESLQLGRRTYMFATLSAQPKFWQYLCSVLKVELPRSIPVPTSVRIIKRFAAAHEHNALSFQVDETESAAHGLAFFDSETPTSHRGTRGAKHAPRIADDWASTVPALAVHVLCRAAVLQILSIEALHRPSRPAALQAIFKEWAEATGSNSSQLATFLQQWLCFTYDAATAELVDVASKQAGVDLSAFRVRGGEAALEAPCLRYGDRFVFDTPLLAKRLGVTDAFAANQHLVLQLLNGTSTTHKLAPAWVHVAERVANCDLAAVWGALAANLAWSLADAQLNLLRATKAFIEVNILRAGGDSQDRGFNTSKLIVSLVCPQLKLLRGSSAINLEALLVLGQILTSMLKHQLPQASPAAAAGTPRHSRTPDTTTRAEDVMKHLEAVQNAMSHLTTGQDPASHAALMSVGAHGQPSKEVMLSLQVRLNLLASLLQLFRIAYTLIDRSRLAPDSKAQEVVSLEKAVRAAAGEILPLVCVGLKVAHATQPTAAATVTPTTKSAHVDTPDGSASVMSVGGDLFRVCVALIDVLLQRMGPPNSYLPILRSNRVITALLDSFVAATSTVAFLCEDAQANAGLRGDHSGTADAERAALMSPTAVRAIHESMARAEVVLQFFLFLAQSPAGCMELLTAGVTRALVSDPLFQRMEVVMRRRFGGLPSLSSNAFEPYRWTAAYGHGASLAEWTAAGFGLGPAAYRGYDVLSGDRSAAHRVWCTSVQLMMHLQRTHDRTQVPDAYGSGPLDRLPDLLFEFIDSYQWTIASCLTTRCFTIASLQEASQCFRLIEAALVHDSRWRLWGSSAAESPIAANSAIIWNLLRCAEAMTGDISLCLGNGAHKEADGFATRWAHLAQNHGFSVTAVAPWEVHIDGKHRSKHHEAANGPSFAAVVEVHMMTTVRAALDIVRWATVLPPKVRSNASMARRALASPSLDDPDERTRTLVAHLHASAPQLLGRGPILMGEIHSPSHHLMTDLRTRPGSGHLLQLAQFCVNHFARHYAPSGAAKDGPHHGGGGRSRSEDSGSHPTSASPDTHGVYPTCESLCSSMRSILYILVCTLGCFGSNVQGGKRRELYSAIKLSLGDPSPDAEESGSTGEKSVMSALTNFSAQVRPDSKTAELIQVMAALRLDGTPVSTMSEANKSFAQTVQTVLLHCFQQ